MGKMRHACKILIGKPEGKRPLVIFRRRWVDIKMVESFGLDSSDRVLGSREHGNEDSGSIKKKGREFLDYLRDNEVFKKNSSMSSLCVMNVSWSNKLPTQNI
jgi:hypothetical protein